MNELNQIRVLHIVGDSAFGGASKIILRLAEMMRREGCQVDVLTTNPVFQRAAQSNGIGTINIDVIRREIRPFWDLGGLFRLYRFLRRERYQLVHTHTSKAGFVGRLAAWLARVPVIVHTTHGFAFHEHSSRAKRLFYSVLERLASHWCDRVIFVSEFHRRWAIDLGICGEEKIIAIPNGIARHRPASPAAVAELRRAWGAGENVLAILSTGRLAPEKGLEHLIEAASSLRRAGQRFRVVLAGDGPMRAQVEQLARDCDVAGQVLFLGYREDIPELLAACDLVVLPSLREGLSIALLEAMAAGKAIIATSIGSNLTVASQADMALLVPPCHPQALAEAILACARDPKLRSRLGSNARLVFDSRYTEDKMLSAYRRVYLKLLGRSPKSSSEKTPALHRLVRRAKEADLPSIVEIHRKAFQNFFLTDLGRLFIEQYYRLVLNYSGGILLVSEAESGIEGFAGGFADPGSFYASMRHNRRTFALPILAAIVRRPSLLGKVIRGVRRVQQQGMNRTSRACELSSIAVTPEARGRGAGRSLVNAFLEHAWRLGARQVRLDTDADKNDAVNVLYQKMGFRQNRRFEKSKRRWMNEYVIDRPEPGEKPPSESYEKTANRY